MSFLVSSKFSILTKSEAEYNLTKNILECLGYSPLGDKGRFGAFQDDTIGLIANLSKPKFFGYYSDQNMTSENHFEDTKTFLRWFFEEVKCQKLEKWSINMDREKIEAQKAILDGMGYKEYNILTYDQNKYICCKQDLSYWFSDMAYDNKFVNIGDFIEHSVIKSEESKKEEESPKRRVCLGLPGYLMFEHDYENVWITEQCEELTTQQDKGKGKLVSKINGFEIYSNIHPEVKEYDKHIYLRGSESEYDNLTFKYSEPVITALEMLCEEKQKQLENARQLLVDSFNEPPKEIAQPQNLLTPLLFKHFNICCKDEKEYKFAKEVLECLGYQQDNDKWTNKCTGISINYRPNIFGLYNDILIENSFTIQDYLVSLFKEIGFEKKTDWSIPIDKDRFEAQKLIIEIAFGCSFKFKYMTTDNFFLHSANTFFYSVYSKSSLNTITHFSSLANLIKDCIKKENNKVDLVEPKKEDIVVLKKVVGGLAGYLMWEYDEQNKKLKFIEQSDKLRGSIKEDKTLGKYNSIKIKSICAPEKRDNIIFIRGSYKSQDSKWISMDDKGLKALELFVEEEQKRRKTVEMLTDPLSKKYVSKEAIEDARNWCGGDQTSPTEIKEKESGLCVLSIKLEDQDSPKKGKTITFKGKNGVPYEVVDTQLKHFLMKFPKWALISNKDNYKDHLRFLMSIGFVPYYDYMRTNSSFREDIPALVLLDSRHNFGLVQTALICDNSCASSIEDLVWWILEAVVESKKLEKNQNTKLEISGLPPKSDHSEIKFSIEDPELHNLLKKYTKWVLKSNEQTYNNNLEWLKKLGFNTSPKVPTDTFSEDYPYLSVTNKNIIYSLQISNPTSESCFIANNIEELYWWVHEQKVKNTALLNPGIGNTEIQNMKDLLGKYQHEWSIFGTENNYKNIIEYLQLLGFERMLKGPILFNSSMPHILINNSHIMYCNKPRNHVFRNIDNIYEWALQQEQKMYHKSKKICQKTIVDDTIIVAKYPSLIDRQLEEAGLPPNYTAYSSKPYPPTKPDQYFITRKHDTVKTISNYESVEIPKNATEAYIEVEIGRKYDESIDIEITFDDGQEIKEENPNYQKELVDYNIVHKQYKKDLKEYNKNLAIYKKLEEKDSKESRKKLFEKLYEEFGEHR